jgi:hypothetical protein
MDESADAVARSVLALWLSGGAVAVALLAAGFTFWQAVTEHLSRVRPLRADWVFTAEDSHRTPLSNGWFLENVGGTTATNVSLTVDHLMRLASGERVVSANAESPIAPGRTVRLAGTGNRPSPVRWWLPNDDRPGSYKTASLDEAGRPENSEAVRLFGQWATVSWTDDSGKPRSKRVPIY